MIVSRHELRLAILEARLASLERRISALTEPTSGRTYQRRYVFERDAPGIVERDAMHREWADRCWTVGEVGALMAKEGEDAQSGGD